PVTDGAIGIAGADALQQWSPRGRVTSLSAFLSYHGQRRFFLSVFAGREVIEKPPEAEKNDYGADRQAQAPLQHGAQTGVAALAPDAGIAQLAVGMAEVRHGSSPLSKLWRWWAEAI